MKTLFLALLQLSLALPCTLLAHTLEIDAIALGRLGTGLSPEGWAVTNVSNYADSYSSALRLNLKASSIHSPVFADAIVGVELEVISSNTNDRRLVVAPLAKGRARDDLKVRCAYSPTKNRFLAQTFAWPRSACIDALAFALEGGGSTGWGIRKLVLTLAPRPAPFVLRIK